MKEISSEVIENIVGTSRHGTRHIARAVSKDEEVYILHSRSCLLSHQTVSLTACSYSMMLDSRGIDEDTWYGFTDKPVYVRLTTKGLVPDGEVDE